MKGLMAVDMMPVSDSDKLLSTIFSNLTIWKFVKICLNLTIWKDLASIGVPA